jgi:hypothetical protein
MIPNELEGYEMKEDCELGLFLLLLLFLLLVVRLSLSNLSPSSICEQSSIIIAMYVAKFLGAAGSRDEQR